MFRKIGVALLLLVPTFASANFPDVFGSNPSWNAIRYVQEEGIVEGYPNGQFKPNNLINRAEFVKILVNTAYAESEISGCQDTSFKDVAANDWFAPYVCKAKKEAIIDGYPDGTFQAANYVSFVEAAKILRNTMLANEPLVKTHSFTEWYGPYVNALSVHQAIPVSVTAFGNPITRQEMAEMIYRLDADLTFMPSLSIWEIGDRSLIEKYYSLISGGKYEEAYAMKAEPDMTLEEFKTMYQDFPHAYVDTFDKAGAHAYEFTVMTYPNLLSSTVEKTASERYKVKMEVLEGKLKTLSSDKMNFQLLEGVTNGHLHASIEWENGAYIISIMGKAETEAARYDTKNALSMKIKNLSFSPDGKYLTWEFSEWEMGGVVIYDIASQKQAEPFFGTSFYGFTKDSAKFYSCSESGMMGGGVESMDLPGLMNRISVLEGEPLISGCGPYDAEKNILQYSVEKTGEGATLESYKF